MNKKNLSLTLAASIAGKKKHGQSQHGTSLIEVLVSVLLLSLGLIGTTQLITSTIKERSALRYQSVATGIAQGLAERMRANRLAVLTPGLYVDSNASGVALTSPRNYVAASAAVAEQSTLPTTGCCTDAATLAAWDIDHVEFSLRTSLPKAALSLRVPKINDSTSVQGTRMIVIAWIEPIFYAYPNPTETTAGAEVVLDDLSNGCPAGFNDSSNPRQNVRCLQYGFKL